MVEILMQFGEETRRLLMGLPRRMAPTLFGMEPRQIESRLDEEVRRILLQLSRSREAQTTAKPRLRRRPGRPRKPA